MVVHHQWIPPSPARFARPEQPLPESLRFALEVSGIEELYSHQAEALDAVRSGGNVLAVTPTASGKTLVFALPVLADILANPGTHALFLYPTKALAQDQVAGLRHLASATGLLRPPRIEIYDGDTPQAVRKKIRAAPPEILVTNPDMLHLGILAHHQDWARLLAGLRWVVLDELHVYRGVFGAHVHHILRRLRRLSGKLGSRPRYLAASATVGGPAEFAETLVGEPFTVVGSSGAPRAGRHVLFVNPVAVSPYTVAVRIVAEAVRHGSRTIAFTKARRVTELLHTWLVDLAPDLAEKVASYRAGYLPEERRRIEERLFRGDLRAVLTTSALELGIDVGGLDACVLVGYPGSLTSAWQRIGRVGREDREALVVLVALPDSLDQYVIAHPDLFFGGAFERAVLDPWNPHVAGHHLVCAAAEEPLARHEIESQGPRGEKVVRALEEDGRLVQDAEGTRWFSFRRKPHRGVSVRGAGDPFEIVNRRSGKVVGSIDGMRVYHECHPGAVYLHAGGTYLVRALDTEARRAVVEPAHVDYYTVVLGEKETEILEEIADRSIGATRAGLGRLKVTVRIHGYQKKRLFGGETISEHPLVAPPLTFETVGFWVEIPRGLPAETARRGLHFMGGIHAAEHATIGLFPLLAISDRGDVGGISYTTHPQTGGPAVFVYDGVAGGAGLAEVGFGSLEVLLRRTLEHVASCSCEEGCPACIHSPRCGNGNKPLDKEAACLVLRVVLGDETVADVPEDAPLEQAAPERLPKHGITRGTPTTAARTAGGSLPVAPVVASAGERVLFFDIETKRGADEVGGWTQIARMGLALAVVYDEERRCYRTYHEADVDKLLLDLVMADRVVGFNIERFDLVVLRPYTEWDLRRIRSVDLLAEIHGRLGFRPSLGHLAEMNLGESKSADGLQSLRWWKEGRIDLIERYCRKDVEMTRRLYDLGRERGHLLYRDYAGCAVRVPVRW